MNRVKSLESLDQAIWLDYIRRDILIDGTLKRWIDHDGIKGLTSNPAIFQKAIGESDQYDEAIREMLADNEAISTAELYEELVVQDIRLAADLLMPVYRTTGGRDGYVSLEVSPHLARDTDASVREARRLWQRVDRANLLIKIPATGEGLPAIERLLGEGINVNITLMFSLAHYEAVAQAFLRSLPRAPEPQRLASVASFFVSRVDSKVDARLDELGSDEAKALRGRVAIANSKLAYARFQELFDGPEFRSWRQGGVFPQRVLWASTSTKDPSYRDVVYLEELIGPETVNTVPPHTLEAFRDHGEVRPSLTAGLAEARRDLDALARLGIDLAEITDELQREGVDKFARPFEALMATLDDKRGRLLAGRKTSAATE